MIESIDRVRALHKLSKKSLCKQAGISTITYSKLLAGADPKLSTVIKLAKVLGLTIKLTI